MGCGGSTSNNLDSPVKTNKGSIFKRQAKVSISVGKAVTILNSRPKVIFLFGGPGTKKGKIVDNLANVFGFEVINVEKLIIQNLAKRLEEPDPNATVKAIQIMLKKEPELLKLNEVLKMLVKRLEQVNKDKFCIVDFMPNLKWMLSNATFIKECINEFRFFEEKFPISFAIHFLIPKEKVLNKLELECAKHPNATPVAAPKAESASKSDEADVGRTQKRLLLYESSVKHFLEYFVKTDKMVTVDVSCGLPDVIWCKICTFFTDFDFPATRTPETVIIFGFDANDLNEMHIEQYSLTMVNLKEIVLDANDPVDLLIDQLCKYLDSCDPTRRVFAVDSTGTTLNKTLTNRKSKKTILFHDEGGNCKLGRYCAVNITDKGDPVELQGIATLENEVCLFSKSVPLDVCIYIGSALASYRACPVKR